MGALQANSQHGCAIVLDTHGVLLIGPSGSGKSRLAHLLIERWAEQGRYARWVADDRFLSEQVGNRLVVHCPLTISGLAERRFLGIESVAWQSRAVIDLVVELVGPDQLERLPNGRRHWRSPTGDDVPSLAVPKQSLEQAVALVEARLREKLRP